MEDMFSSSCRRFSLDEIKEATNNFDEKKVIGHGGEGKVYMAEIYLGSGSEKSRVAVKHLKENSDEFEKEIQIVTKIQHPHLVSLLGYCNESNQKILIYEYMEKGSLSDHVKTNSGSIYLPWKLRLKICLGAAHGLQHLHKETDEFPRGIIHRDVKPANILLGENWVAKVSDFGMFKVSIAGQTNSAVITNLKGTCGYYAPEYVRSCQITRKIDVYAFGVVLFEVLCQKKPWERGDKSYYVGENENFGLWAQENVDANFKMEISYDSLNAFTDIIGRSMQSDPNKRPAMDDVIQALETALKCQQHKDERIHNIHLKATRHREGERQLTLNHWAPEIDTAELVSLFSTASTSDGPGKGGNESKRVRLVEWKRGNSFARLLAYKKIPVADIISDIYAWDASALGIDYVGHLIRFCPTKEKMELLKGYKGDKEMLGKYEQLFMELMKIPRVESKLKVLEFKLKFSYQVNDLIRNLTTINDAAREVKESTKLGQIMQTILNIGNALNQGTTGGSARELRLDTLLKLSETRARNNKMTLMQYACKLLAEKKPELLDFDKDLVHLVAASVRPWMRLTDKKNEVLTGLQKVELELTASKNDGAISASFQEVFQSFLDTAEAEVKSLMSLYSEVGRNTRSVVVYFGEDPTQTSFERVTGKLARFVRMFKKARYDNGRQADVKKKNLETEALKEQAAANSLSKEDSEVDSENDMKT